MESFSNICRFILSCNYSSKIISPIQSRCAVFRFKPLSDKDILKLISKISKEEIPEFLEKNIGKHVFIYYQDGIAKSMIIKDPSTINEFVQDRSNEYKKLDVVILRDMIFQGIMGLSDLKIDDDIFYERWWNEAIQKVDEGKYKVAFILNPTRAEQVLAVAKNHERMPQKSTDFYPKMISGLTMMSLEDGEKLN